MPVLHITVTVSGTGNDPGDMKLVVETVDEYVAPTYKHCWTRSGTNNSLGVLLNSVGEAYFGLQKDDVNTAIAEAVTAAINQLVAAADTEEICNDLCLSVTGEGSGSEGAATAFVRAIIGSYEEGDELCDPLSAGGAVTGLYITCSAPGPVIGLDVTDLLNNADTAEFSTPAVAGSILSALLGAGGILDWDGTDYRLYVDLGSGNFARMAMAVSPQGLEIVGRIGGMDSYGNGYYSIDIPLADPDPSTITAMTPSSLPGCPVTVGSVITKVPGASLEISDEYLELNNGGGDPETYEPTTSENFDGSGYVRVAYTNTHYILVDPGVPHTPCRIHWTFITIYPIQANPGCYNHMELLQDALHKDAPRLYAPPCIKVWNKSMAV
ncbi:hypothetical protein [Planctomicrobium piriforme]|uniref:Uncharacterized protein n=1 Tax=Planctomicrobium piriforme TaxID=1576369 RepID=A0A1I3L2X1_9PLAN|nr:hypothetical protein [Planctomicrobium piriforme]SFI78765.1 hypothetical protein SAMN05421753_112115 [Planctomicrobium piriforme]